MGNSSVRGVFFSLGAGLFLSYLALALTLPVVSRHVTATLGFASWLGGLAAGALFISTILTRPRSGYLADRAGGKVCSFRGLKVYLAASAVCLASGWGGLPPALALAVLIAGRLVLGLGESLVTVGVTAWGIAALGSARSGTIMVVMGTAIYGAYAVGGPLGVAIYDHYGFAAVLLVASALPLPAYAILSRLAEVPPKSGVHVKPATLDIVRRIYKYGIVVALQGVGFAVIGTFVSAYFVVRGWSNAGWALTFFGASFLLVRFLFGGKPDKHGGVPVTLISLCVEALGLVLLWQAPSAGYALLGASLTGLGCSLVFPSMGIEAIMRVPEKFRGTAYGVYAVFQDVSYAFTGPIAGFVADRAGYGSVFLFGFIAVGVGAVLVMTSLQRGVGQARKISS